MRGLRVVAGARMLAWPHVLEDVLHYLPRQEVAGVRDEERCAGIGVGVPVAHAPVLRERPDHAVVDGQAARFVELALAHSDRPGQQIDIAHPQLEGL